MRITQILLFILFITFLSCNRKIDIPNQFSSDCDTLIVKMEKIKGTGMFPAGAGEIHFETKNRFIDFPLEIPDNISDVKIGFELFDFKPWKYHQYKKGKLDKSAILEDVLEGRIDTLIAPSLKENSICIMSGIKDGKNIFIVDENINQDFTDDSIRFYSEMDWKTTKNLIKCKYHIYNGEKIITDSTWINIGQHPLDSTILLYYVSNHLVAELSVDSHKYQIGVVDEQDQFWFDDPILALTSEDGVMKDSLLKSELLSTGEYLKLNDNYYRLDNITNDGSYITLIKEKDVSNKIGTQVGFLAPDFSFLSTEEDSINFTDYKGKYLLLANLTACWSEPMSYEHYKELTEEYASKLNIIGIDMSPNFLTQNIKDLNLTGTFVIAKNNPSIQNNYREDYCSRTCFLIDPEGQIADKFEIFNWKVSLAKYFD